jgi:hypothetical protein
MKHLLNITRSINNLAAKLHCKSLTVVADRADTTVANGYAARDRADAALSEHIDSAYRQFDAVKRDIDNSQQKARLTLAAAVAEAEMLGFLI